MSGLARSTPGSCRRSARVYWEDWATDVVDIARRHHQRISDILAQEPAAAEAFAGFLAGLRANLNDGVGEGDAIAMVSQHLITAPIFEALFGGGSFALANPVSQAMEEIVAVLDTYHLQTETESLDRFYDSVRQRVEGIPLSDGLARQRIIKDLYGRFFSRAFPAMSASLGIVYTPIEVVDFILRAAEAVLREHFGGASLSDEGVHVLDPFTGTGTFLTRLLQSGLIRPEDLARKYASELHANEILLLAYYIAAVNIETTYRQVAGVEAQEPFPGIVLTDTFAMGEGSAGGALDVFPLNNERAERQRGLDIRVIVGNPPYSATGNLAYPALDRLIAESYVARSTGTRVGALYDAYLRAIRWASRRVIESDEGGVVAFVTNGGFLDSNAADGVRLTLAEEFHHIYVYNLRGNARTAADLRAREAGNVFGGGSRNTVAVTLLVRRRGVVRDGGGTIHYRDIGDHLSRTEKLQIVNEGLRPTAFGPAGMADLGWQDITPNAQGDWINQRSTVFDTLLPLHDDDEPSIFGLRTNGLKSNRDAWNYNASRALLERNTERMLAHYNDRVDAFVAAHPGLPGTQQQRAAVAKAWVEKDPTAFSWDRADFTRLVQGHRYTSDDAQYQVATYRPFVSRYSNAGRRLNNTVYKLPRVFPRPGVENLAIGILEAGGSAPFSVLMVDRQPDDKLAGAGNAMQFLPRWVYPATTTTTEGQLDGLAEGVGCTDGITGHALERCRTLDPDCTEDDVFFAVYGILHSPEYREVFAADLKRSLPRIPIPGDADDLRAFAEAGRQLANLHTEFEDVEVWPDLDFTYTEGFDADVCDHLRVTKMRWAKVPDPDNPGGRRIDDKTTLVYNDWIAIRDIPLRAHDYRVGARSALDWVVDQQQVKTDKASGITNDPNDWADEHDDPRYLLDLVGRVVTVSMRTLDIVDTLPSLGLLSQANATVSTNDDW